MKERRRRAPWIHQHSAGGVIVRTDVPEPLFLAIKPANRDRWQLPKGTIDPGESPQEAAVREVREEGGVSGRIVAPLERSFVVIG